MAAKSKLNVLHVIPHFYPAWAYGGTPRAIFELTRVLASKQTNITVTTTDAFNQSNRLKLETNPQVKNKIKIFRFKNISNFLAFNMKFSTPIGLTSFLNKNLYKFNLIHLHEFRTLLNLITIQKARHHRLPIILQPHGTFLNYNTNQLSKFIFDSLFKKFIINNITHFIVLSETEKKDLVDQGVSINSISIIPNGIKPLPKPAKLSLPPSFILYLGRLDGMKGLKTLITSFSHLHLKYSRLKLIIAGTGNSSYIYELKHLTKKLAVDDKVIWFGYANQKQKTSLLQQAKISCYYSSKEAFGLVPLESILAFTPTIVSNQVGSSTYVKLVNGGVVVPFSNNARYLVAALDQILKRPKKLKNISLARKKVLKSLSWSKVALQHQQLYRKILKT